MEVRTIYDGMVISQAAPLKSAEEFSEAWKCCVTLLIAGLTCFLAFGSLTTFVFAKTIFPEIPVAAPVGAKILFSETSQIFN